MSIAMVGPYPGPFDRSRYSDSLSNSLEGEWKPRTPTTHLLPEPQPQPHPVLASECRPKPDMPHHSVGAGSYHDNGGFEAATPLSASIDDGPPIQPTAEPRIRRRSMRPAFLIQRRVCYIVVTAVFAVLVLLGFVFLALTRTAGGRKPREAIANETNSHRGGNQPGSRPAAAAHTYGNYGHTHESLSDGRAKTGSAERPESTTEHTTIPTQWETTGRTASSEHADPSTPANSSRHGLTVSSVSQGEELLKVPDTRRAGRNGEYIGRWDKIRSLMPWNDDAPPSGFTGVWTHRRSRESLKNNTEPLDSRLERQRELIRTTSTQTKAEPLAITEFLEVVNVPERRNDSDGIESASDLRLGTLIAPFD